MVLLIQTMWELFKNEGDCVEVGKQNLVVFNVFGVSPYERLREHWTGVDIATHPLFSRSSALRKVFLKRGKCSNV